MNTATMGVAIILTFLLPAAPFSPLCESGTYRHTHPLICDTGNSAPGALPNTGGGGNGSGLLGLINDLTGGLL